MTKSTITREQLEEWVAQFDEDGGCDATDRQLEALIRQSLAAMESEPVRNPVLSYADSYRDMAKQGVESVPIWSVITDLERNIAPLYRHAQPAPERDQVRQEHAEWSQATFGNVGPVGPLKHLSKEALEAAAEPSDLFEWADMHFLLWDAQRRAGITDEQITQAMIEKLAVNKQRSWPEPKDGEPRLHIKEQVAPVVPDERAAFNAWNNEDNLPIAGVSAKNAAWLAWQARAMLQAGNSPVIPDDTLRMDWLVSKTVNVREPMVYGSHSLFWSQTISDDWSEVHATTLREQIDEAMLAAAPQEVPDGK